VEIVADVSTLSCVEAAGTGVSNAL